jgi:transcription antitermination factor NusG
MGKPAQFEDGALEGLRLASSQRTESKTKFCQGDAALIDKGPFAGLVGVVVAATKGWVVLQLQGMAIPIKVSNSLVKKK